MVIGKIVKTTRIAQKDDKSSHACDQLPKIKMSNVAYAL